MAKHLPRYIVSKKLLPALALKLLPCPPTHSRLCNKGFEAFLEKPQILICTAYSISINSLGLVQIGLNQSKLLCLGPIFFR